MSFARCRLVWRFCWMWYYWIQQSVWYGWYKQICHQLTSLKARFITQSIYTSLICHKERYWSLSLHRVKCYHCTATIKGVADMFIKQTQQLMMMMMMIIIIIIIIQIFIKAHTVNISSWIWSANKQFCSKFNLPKSILGKTSMCPLGSKPAASTKQTSDKKC